MPSSFTNSLRFNLQGSGDNLNTWGDVLNASVFDLADTAIAGWLTKPLTADALLSVQNGGQDEARNAMVKFTGGGPFTVTIPSVSKAYDLWNACSAPVTITTGAGTNVAVQPGEIVRVVSDGADVNRSQGTYFDGRRITSLADPLNPQDGCTKAYADALAFTANTGILPGQTGAAGQALFSNGTNAFWKAVESTDMSDFNDRIVAIQVALAVAL